MGASNKAGPLSDGYTVQAAYLKTWLINEWCSLSESFKYVSTITSFYLILIE